MFSSQVHVVFNSDEDSRITKPIINANPNKLYYFKAYIKATDQGDQNIEFYESNIKEFREKLPNLEIVEKTIDYTDYIEIIQELSKIIKNERANDPECKIYFNVGSGSKMTSLACSEAAKLWKCKIYYVHSTLYDPRGSGGAHKGKIIVKEPITFPIQKPDKEVIEMLKCLENSITERYEKKDINPDQKFIYKKELVDILEEKGFLNIESKNKNPRKYRSSLYMSFNHRVADKLEEEFNYIRISDDKRNQKVFITDTGEQILKIFRYLI